VRLEVEEEENIFENLRIKNSRTSEGRRRVE